MPNSPIRKVQYEEYIVCKFDRNQNRFEIRKNGKLLTPAIGALRKLAVKIGIIEENHGFLTTHQLAMRIINHLNGRNPRKQSGRIEKKHITAPKKEVPVKKHIFSPNQSIILSCGGRKHPEAGTLKTKEGKCVQFVADPQNCEKDPNFVYARPDDPSDQDNKTWREVLCEYNTTHQGEKNPLNLKPAYQLYTPIQPHQEIYTEIKNKIGSKQFYIFSAGWGLVRSDFLLPKYDITFSPSVKSNLPWIYRSADDNGFHDFCHIKPNYNERIYFFGSCAYVKPLTSILEHNPSLKEIYYHTKKRKEKFKSLKKKENFSFHNIVNKFNNQHTWYYEAAQIFINNGLPINS